MPNVPISSEDVAALLEQSSRTTTLVELTEEQKLYRKHNPSFGDLSGKYITWHDTWPPNQRLKCLSRGCGIQTPYKVQGMPKCTIHALLALAIILDQKDGISQ